MPEQTTLEVKAPSRRNGYLFIAFPQLFELFLSSLKAAKKHWHALGVGRALSTELTIGEARDEAAPRPRFKDFDSPSSCCAAASATRSDEDNDMRLTKVNKI